MFKNWVRKFKLVLMNKSNDTVYDDLHEIRIMGVTAY